MPNRTGLSPYLPVLLATAAMELCRWYIAAGLFFMIPERGSIPLLPSGLALTGAMFLSLLMSRLKKRRIADLLAHSIGLAASLCLMLKSFTGLPFHYSKGTAGFFRAYSMISTPGEWFSLALVVGWTLLLWLRGRHLGSRPGDYKRTVARFDAGILLIFAVYFLRMGIRLEDPHAISSVSAYLLFGILAIYAARNRDRDRNFIHTTSAFGLVLLFTVGFILLGTVGVVLYPLMADTAGEVYSVIRKGTEPFQPLIIAFLRFLFGRRSAVSAGTAGAGPSSEELSTGPPREPGFWMQLFEKILVYSIGGILAILTLLIAGYLLWRLAGYLFAPGKKKDEGIAFREFLRILLQKISEGTGILLRAVRKIPEILLKGRRRNLAAGSSAFRKLISWGRFSGIRIETDETAGEYGRRLAKAFPPVSDAVRAIVRYAESETYGERALSGEERLELRRARRKTGTFRLLPLRLANRMGFRR